VLFIFCHLYTGGVYSVCLRGVYSVCLRCVYLAMGCVYSVGVIYRIFTYCGCVYCMCVVHTGTCHRLHIEGGGIDAAICVA